MEMRIAVLGSQSMEQESLLKSFMKDSTLFEPNIRFKQIAESETACSLYSITVWEEFA